MKRKNLIWKTVRGSRVAFDKKGKLVIAPKWFRKYYYEKKKR
ncbi:MAG: hypothetical protein ACP6IS_11630 [Candidatus Asgardarchaeia archaeon]